MRWQFWNERRLQRAKVNALKYEIRRRLHTEDYTCRLPRPPKPRVRYKLTLYHWYDDDAELVMVYQ